MSQEEIKACTGTVKWWSWRRGFGFINTAALPGIDVFVHYSAIEGEERGQRNLYEAQGVQFDAVPNVRGGRRRGWKAINVRELRS